MPTVTPTAVLLPGSRFDFIEGDRWVVTGGSYGGFMTLMTMVTQPDVIKAGAALRPVTDWAHYNHGYTSDIFK